MWAIDCPLLTDLSILELSILPNLRRLALAGLPLVTDISLLFLAEHGTWLKHLQIAHCERIALHTIHVLVRRLERLAYLSTSGVVSTSRIGIKRFSETPPGVRIIRKTYCRNTRVILTSFLIELSFTQCWALPCFQRRANSSPSTISRQGGIPPTRGGEAEYSIRS